MKKKNRPWDSWKQRDRSML